MAKEIVLCDTDVMIEYLKNNPEILSTFLLIGVDNLFISCITKAELQQG
ncbi:MAG: hypothetical protein ACR2FN_01685 [Chitinophagaceae bacterium]